MKGKFLIGLLLLPLVICTKGVAQNVSVESLQAAFIFKFTNYIEWPTSKKNEFSIGVIDASEMYEELKATFSGKEVGDNSVVVHDLKKLENGSTYDILYSKRFEPTLANLKGVLTITSNSKEPTESIINFYLDAENKLKFEINAERANAQGLKINSRLLNLSRPK